MELGRQRGYTPRAFLSPLLAYPMHIPPQESRETLHMMVQEMGALALANTTTMVQVDMLDMVLANVRPHPRGVTSGKLVCSSPLCASVYPYAPLCAPVLAVSVVTGPAFSTTMAHLSMRTL